MFLIVNKSIFEVTLDSKIEGHIKFNNQILQGGKQFDGEPEKIESSGHKWFHFEYRLTKEELELVNRFREPNTFVYDINKLILTIKSIEEFPQVVSKQVKIKRNFQVWNYKEYEKAIEPFSHS